MTSSYVVEEKILYRVDADSEEEAVQHIIDCERRDKHCIGVDERSAYQDERHPAEVYGTPEHEAILIEEERGT